MDTAFMHAIAAMAKRRLKKNHDFKETRTPPARFTASNQLSHEVKEMP